MLNDKKRYFDRLAPEWRAKKKLGGDELALLRYCLSGLDLGCGDIVLDLGGGTGRLAGYLWKVCSARPLVLDVSFAMLKEGRSFLPSPAIGWVQSVAHRLPLRDESVKHVLCFCAFPHFSCPREVLAECRRVLRSGGSFLLLHNCGREEINRFHLQEGGVIASDRLPSPARFRSWGKNSNWEERRLEDSLGRFVVHFRKPR